MESSTAKDTDLHYIWPNSSKRFQNNINNLANKSQVKYQRITPFLLAGMDALALFASLYMGKLIYWEIFRGEGLAEFSLDLGPVWAQS